jgi:hypothetical protein
MRSKIDDTETLLVTGCLPGFTQAPAIADKAWFKASNDVLTHSALFQQVIARGEYPKDSDAI